MPVVKNNITIPKAAPGPIENSQARPLLPRDQKLESKKKFNPSQNKSVAERNPQAISAKTWSSISSQELSVKTISNQDLPRALDLLKQPESSLEVASALQELIVKIHDLEGQGISDAASSELLTRCLAKAAQALAEVAERQGDLKLREEALSYLEVAAEDLKRLQEEVSKPLPADAALQSEVQNKIQQVRHARRIQNCDKAQATLEDAAAYTQFELVQTRGWLKGDIANRYELSDEIITRHLGPGAEVCKALSVRSSDREVYYFSKTAAEQFAANVTQNKKRYGSEKADKVQLRNNDTWKNDHLEEIQSSIYYVSLGLEAASATKLLGRWALYMGGALLANVGVCAGLNGLLHSVGEDEETVQKSTLTLGVDLKNSPQTEASVIASLNILEDNESLQSSYRHLFQQEAASVVSGTSVNATDKPKIKPLEVLVAEAKLHLTTWRAQPEKLLKGYGKFFIHSEILEESDPGLKEMLPQLEMQWAEIIKQLKSVLPQDGQLRTQEDIRRFVKVLRKQFATNVYYHNAAEARMTQNLLADRGNCEGRAKMFLAALIDSGVKLPEGYELGWQSFADHGEPVIYERDKDIVWELMGGRRVQGVLDNIYYPPIIMQAYLSGRNITDIPVSQEELLLAQGNTEIQIDPNYQGKTNSQLAFPKGRNFYSLSGPESATIVLEDFNMEVEAGNSKIQIEEGEDYLVRSFSEQLHVLYSKLGPDSEEPESTSFHISTLASDGYASIEIEKEADFHQIAQVQQRKDLPGAFVALFLKGTARSLQNWQQWNGILKNPQSIISLSPSEFESFTSQMEYVGNLFKDLVSVRTLLYLKKEGVHIDLSNLIEVEQVNHSNSTLEEVRRHSSASAELLNSYIQMIHYFEQDPARLSAILNQLNKHQQEIFIRFLQCNPRIGKFNENTLGPLLVRMSTEHELKISFPKIGGETGSASLNSTSLTQGEWEVVEVQLEGLNTAEKSDKPQDKKILELDLKTYLSSIAFLYRNSSPQQLSSFAQSWTPDFSQALIAQPLYWNEAPDLFFDLLKDTILDIAQARRILNLPSTPEIELDLKDYINFTPFKRMPEFLQKIEFKEKLKLPQDLAAVLDSYLRFIDPGKAPKGKARNLLRLNE